MQLPTDFSYLYGQPAGTALIRTEAEDFQVFEQLPFEPDGEGEHYLVYIRKIGENTDWVARKLARFCHTTPREVGYAGKKDRHAVTEQWFSVKVPIKREVDWTLFNSKTIQVLKAVRHGRKLRLGALKGNRFKLRLREVSQPDELVARLEQIRNGVPNYFGEQRFGNDWNNLHSGLALLSGELKERQRHKKGLYISAVRSWLFNRLLSQRIEQGLWQTLLPGDALMLEGSRSCFAADAEQDMAQLLQRLEQRDLHLTGALWGRGEPMAQLDARQWERDQLAPWSELLGGLEQLGLNQERRALRLLPAALAAHAESERQWWLEFELPAGAFATSVLRELCQVTAPVRGNDA
ncbi:tRNA pseudouridine(13) synthase TruD [Marinobacterium arenosum]|uniref:tRNA pseudouridine(13) synthase TruD n=1 Tax=Marinobacterium arenosum TaxID=2862496 RepID=UPI001C94A417|nr:tRNA pseudouridine(13) synthase TruD [Marinobacterium arenosum]MBY4675663.1 tRNA pseudouridine(13) synthase TruD [Marinobacterium arenosum]